MGVGAGKGRVTYGLPMLCTNEGWGEEAAEHQKHAHVGEFLMFGVRV